MSYDLEVYGKISLTARELAKVVSSVRGLIAAVDRRSQSFSSIIHKRGRAMAFELRLLGGDPWIPADFRGVFAPAVDERCSQAAVVMLESLRYPAPGSPQALRIDAHYARVREIGANSRTRAAEGSR